MFKLELTEELRRIAEEIGMPEQWYKKEGKPKYIIAPDHKTARFYIQLNGLNPKDYTIITRFTDILGKDRGHFLVVFTGERISREMREIHERILFLEKTGRATYEQVWL